MKQGTIYLLVAFIAVGAFLLGFDNPRGGKQNTNPQFNLSFQHNEYTADNSAVDKFVDSLNGVNTIAGLEGRGWKTYRNGTGAPGTAAIWYQGDPISIGINAYNGPPEGFVGTDYNSVSSGNIDNWLVSRKMAISAGDSLSFYAVSYNSDTYPDSIRVMYNPAGDSLPTAGTWVELGRFRILESVANTETWAKHSYVMPSAGANGRFAIRYCITDAGPAGANGSTVGIDYIKLTGSGGPPVTVINPDTACRYGDIPQYPGNSLGQSSQVLGDTLYVVGGGTSGVSSTTVARYAINSGVWSAGTPLPTAKTAGSLVRCGNSLYYLGGGSTTTAPTNQTYKYTPGTGWTSVANIPTPVTGHASVCWGDSVIFVVAGGWSTATTTVQFYRPGNDTWGTSTSLPAGKERRSFAIGIEGNKIVVAAGFQAPALPSNASFRKDVVIGTIGSNAGTITWANGPDAPIPAGFIGSSRAGGTAINGRFYLVPGETAPAAGGAIYPDSVYIMDVTSGTWLPQVIRGRGTNATGNHFGMISANILSNGKVRVWIPGGTGNPASTNPGMYVLTDDCTITGINDPSVNTPEAYKLEQNYPNPFNPSTTIRYSVPSQGLVTLKVYNVLGKEVATLVSEVKSAGNYYVDFNASTLSSGIYFYRLETDNFVETKRMMLVK